LTLRSAHPIFHATRALLAALCLLVAPAVPAALPDMANGTPLPSLAPMLDRVTPAVVNISTAGHVELKQHPLLSDPFFRRFFDVPNMPRERKTQSLGSGVIIDAKRGLVLTNNHVIANADQINVRLNDGRQFAAELVGSDPETDVAVIRIEATGLVGLPSANSDEARVGDFVVAIGNPFGLGQTVTSGIISALARSGLGITGYEDLIQTDASINPGNSGGALVNLRGELVGINTAIYSQSGGNIGIGFAIPVNMARQIMEQLVEFGEVNRGYLGAEMQNMDPELAAAFGLKTAQGAVLVNIVPGSPAEKAGLKPGDVVTAANGRPVRDASDLRNRVGLLRVGDKMSLDVLRDGRRLTVSSVIAGRTATQSAGGIKNERLAGVSLGEIPQKSAYYGQVAGIMVFEVSTGTPAWTAGLREGDVITSVNRTQIGDLPSFLGLVGQVKGALLLGVLRGNRSAYIVIR
jgi:Do/DeqQ family serine protease